MDDYDIDGEYRQLPTVRQPRRDTFVAPAPAPIVRQAPAHLQPTPQELMVAPSVQQVVRMETTHVDRAKGFALRTLILSVVVGVLAVIVAVVMFKEPLIFAVVITYFFTAFAAIWLVAYLWDLATSPDGTALYQVFGGLRMLRREQDFRHERIRHIEGMPQPWERKQRRGKR